MIARAVEPGIPVADQQAVIDGAGVLFDGLRIEPGPGRRRILRVKEHGHRHDQPPAVAREAERADIEGQARDLDRRRAVEIEPPDLAGPRTVRQKIERLAVRGPADLAGPLGRVQPSRRRARRRKVENPGGVAGGVVSEVDRAQVIDDGSAVGRNLRVGEPVQAFQPAGVERCGRGRRHGGHGRDGQDRRAGKHETPWTDHETDVFTSEEDVLSCMAES